jgi:hypothetical protein
MLTRKYTVKNKLIISKQDIDQTNDSSFLYFHLKPEHECIIKNKLSTQILIFSW